MILEAALNEKNQISLTQKTHTILQQSLVILLSLASTRTLRSSGQACGTRQMPIEESSN
jgi:hypothetical protein